jgi:NhaA family Na+:H+ antiporter
MTRQTPSAPSPGLVNALQEFLRLESAGGLVLMAAAVLAMIVANSPLVEAYTGASCLCRISLGVGASCWTSPSSCGSTTG